MNTFGELFRVTTFGESHGKAMGALIDGCPAGVEIDLGEIQHFMDRRRPGQSALTTDRKEGDEVEILSGVFEGKTLGTPIACVVKNKGARSKDYDKLKEIDRAGHADLVWRTRYPHRDHRGGGRTSGRETLSRVIGGAFAEALLKRETPDIKTVAWVSQVGKLKAANPPLSLTRTDVDQHATRCPDAAMRDSMAETILQAKENADSLGGTIDVRIQGLPIGLGEPIFDKLKARLAYGLASIGTVAGVFWGPFEGPAAFDMMGSEFHSSGADVYGGVQGGLANGEPVHLRIWCKPPATLGEHARGGRHDPCILPRAVPVVEAMVSLVIADLYLHMLARPHRA